MCHPAWSLLWLKMAVGQLPRSGAAAKHQRVNYYKGQSMTLGLLVVRLTHNIYLLLESGFHQEGGSQSSEKKPQQSSIPFYIQKL